MKCQSVVENGDAGLALALYQGPTPATKQAAPFEQPRDFLANRFVYLTISPRARGLSIGVNLNPNGECNFNCVYCEADRERLEGDQEIDCDVAAVELEEALGLVNRGELNQYPPYKDLPKELLRLRHVALSGNGEPTISPKFLEAVEMVVHLRALGRHPFFKIVLITNGTGLDRPKVQAGLNMLTPRDEVWVKLDAGTTQSMEVMNRSTVPLDQLLKNILLTARRRPVIIQSLFCQVGRNVPTVAEIEAFAARVKELKEQGAQITLVQIYSATRPTPHSDVRHLPLKSLSDIAAIVRRVAGVNAEPF